MNQTGCDSKTTPIFLNDFDEMCAFLSISEHKKLNRFIRIESISIIRSLDIKSESLFDCRVNKKRIWSQEKKSAVFGNHRLSTKSQRNGKRK